MQKRVVVIVVVAVVVVAGVAGGLWWFLRDDAPEAVSLDAARESVEATGSTTGSADGDATVAGADAVDGVWTVDTETGEFDFDTASGTFAGFRVQEELSTIGSTTAVGRTGDVSGSITIEGSTVTGGSVEVDLTTITTNDSRRDDNVQSALETDQFPTATYTLTEPIELGPAALDGEPVSITGAGELTIKGTTRPVEVPIEAQIVDGVVIVVGSLDLSFSDYGVETPSAPIVLSVSDEGVMEFQLLLGRS